MVPSRFYELALDLKDFQVSLAGLGIYAGGARCAENAAHGGVWADNAAVRVEPFEAVELKLAGLWISDDPSPSG